MGSPVAPLYGLVLAGGRSERMRKDPAVLSGEGGAGKAALAYHGRPQAQVVADLLRVHCEKVFLSCRAEQGHEPAFAGLTRLEDRYEGLGPLAGILSALDAYPTAAWLVAACDLPYLDAASVATLVAGRDLDAFATAFEGPQESKGGHGHRGSGPQEGKSAGDGEPLVESLGPNGRLPEPLFTIFEPRMGPRIHALRSQGLDCPRKAILRSRSRVLEAPDPGFLRNVNDPDEYRRALRDLGDSGS